MPAQATVAQAESATVIRSVRLRLLPETKAVAYRLAGQAGACRFVWNHFLARKQQEYAAFQAGRREQAPSLTFFSLGQEFTALRKDPHYAWLRAYSCHEVRYALKYLADAYKAFFQGTRAYPQFKSKHHTTDGFTIADGVRVADHCLWVPKMGWLRLKGANPHADGQPLQARIRQEGTRHRPKWYVYLTYAVLADAVKPPCTAGVLGLDRNVGQVTDSQGHIYPMTDQAQLDTKIQRKQREQARKQKGSVRHRRAGGQLTKLKRKQKNIRANDTHHISRELADKAHTIVVEDLNTAGMTKAAKGTVEAPGQNVKAKAGLNRVILASNWYQLYIRLLYKCAAVVQVDPRHTSQTCHRCGCVDKRNRTAQAVFHCISCGLRMHADHNAAINILVRYLRTVARGTGATARRAAFPPGTALTREQDIRAESSI